MELEQTTILFCYALLNTKCCQIEVIVAQWVGCRIAEFKQTDIFCDNTDHDKDCLGVGQKETEGIKLWEVRGIHSKELGER